MTKHIDFHKKYISLHVETESRLVAGAKRRERKVRAAKGIPLLKMEAVGDSRLRQKKTTAFFREGKGEKVVQETTSWRVIVRLCPLGAASSCIPSTEGCPPEPCDGG